MSTRRSWSRPGIREAAASLAAIAAVLALLALIDERVREEGRRMASGQVSGELTAVGARAGSAGSSLLATVRALDPEQMSLALFVLVATVLVIAMLRT